MKRFRTDYKIGVTGFQTAVYNVENDLLILNMIKLGK